MVSKMEEMIINFPTQLREALGIGESVTIKAHYQTITRIYAIGMGGSGIGSDFVASFIADECTIPYGIGKSYQIPAWVDSNTLCIAGSYSGNTEETLSALAMAEKAGAKIVVITSGGSLQALAEERGFDMVLLPDTWTSPRACVGYAIVCQLEILNRLACISRKKIDLIKSSIDLIKYDMDEIRSKAEKIAKILFGKMPVIYVEDRMEPVALRFRQQLNENSKVLSWHNVFPEMTHNELVGWTQKTNDLAVVIFRNKDDHKRNMSRIDISRDILAKYSNTVIEIFSKGQSLVEKSIYLLHLSDWISYYLAVLQNVDPVEIKVIDVLKKKMSEI